MRRSQPQGVNELGVKKQKKSSHMLEEEHGMKYGEENRIGARSTGPCSQEKSLDLILNMLGAGGLLDGDCKHRSDKI